MPCCKSKWAALAGFVGWTNLVGLLLLLGACERDFERPPEPALVIGQITLAGGLPISSARVRLPECSLNAETNVEGWFRIDQVPDGEYTLEVTAEVFDAVTGKFTSYTATPGRPVIVRGPAVTDLGSLAIQQSGWVAGRVNRPDGGLVLNTLVFLESANHLTVTSLDGQFSLAAVPAGTFSLRAARPGQLSAATAVSVTAGQVSQVDLTLADIPSGAVGSLAGRVLLGNPGPEPGVRVFLIERFSSRRIETLTDSGGGFSFVDVPAGVYELVAEHEGYQATGKSNLVIGAGQPAELPDLVLPPQGTGGSRGPVDGDPNGVLDDDFDGIRDTIDNCPAVPNPGQVDEDGDGIGDACDESFLRWDRDGDGFRDDRDNCPDRYNPEQSDEDRDGLGDWCDLDFLDRDRDGDGVVNGLDNCPEESNSDQANHDDDPLGDACDPDKDNDGIANNFDACELVADPQNDAFLCSFRLVFAAQDQSGAIHLVQRRRSQNTDEDRPLTTGAGQALEPSAYQDDTGAEWVYFQRRLPGDTDSGGEMLARICRVRVGSPQDLAAVECLTQPGEWNRGHPRVCALDRVNPFLLFEEDSAEGYRLFVTRLDPNGGPPGPALEVDAPKYHPPYDPVLARKTGFRYPACAALYDATGLISPTILYAVDFYSMDNMPDWRLDWNLHSASYLPPDFPDSGKTLGDLFGGIDLDRTTHVRRSCAAEIEGLEPGVIHEREQAGRTDLVFSQYGGNGWMRQELVADGAENLHPAWTVVTNPKTGVRSFFLAYQSDRAGSVDVYLLALSSGVRYRVTDGAGFEGMPAWLPQEP